MKMNSHRLYLYGANIQELTLDTKKDIYILCVTGKLTRKQQLENKKRKQFITQFTLYMFSNLMFFF